MNRIKQNKVNFTLILTIIIITFSSLTILSLPVLFNYKSKVTKIEKNFYKNFKIYLKTTGNISYKPFPKPHLLVENAYLNLSQPTDQDNFIFTKNLKIFISLRDIYLRSFDNFISTQILNTNLDFEISDFKDFRKHLYQKINKPIILKECRLFLRNKNEEVILISPIKKILYKINAKSKNKIFLYEGNLFGLNLKSVWKRNYETPNLSYHNINIVNPNIEIKNKFKYEKIKKFSTYTQILYSQDKLNYNILFDNNIIKINSPDEKNINFNINGNIQLEPFYFDGELTIKNKKIKDISENLLLNLISYDENLIGNFNGNLKIKFNELDNKLIKNGEIDISVNEKKINIKRINFSLDKIGELDSEIGFMENLGEKVIVSKNVLNIKNHIEFAKAFQIGSKKIKKIKKVYFDLEKVIGSDEFILKNIGFNNFESKKTSQEIFIVKNIQNLRSHIRKVID